MDKNIPDISLLKAYLIGGISPKEEEAVDLWISQSPENINILESLAGADQVRVPVFDYLEVKSQLLEKIGSEYEENVERRSAIPAYRTVTTTHNGREMGSSSKAAAEAPVTLTA